MIVFKCSIRPLQQHSKNQDSNTTNPNNGCHEHLNSLLRVIRDIAPPPSPILITLVRYRISVASQSITTVYHSIMQTERYKVVNRISSSLGLGAVARIVIYVYLEPIREMVSLTSNKLYFLPKRFPRLIVENIRSYQIPQSSRPQLTLMRCRTKELN
jgi:hypothetical protein